MVNREILRKSDSNLYLKERNKADFKFCNELIVNENNQIDNIISIRQSNQNPLSGVTSIFLVTGGSGKIYLNQQEIELCRNDLIQVPQNTWMTVKEHRPNIYLTGFRFSARFITEAQIPKKVLRIFNGFSSNFLSVIKLEEKEADFINRQIRELYNDKEMCEGRLFGKELLMISFQKFLMSVGGLSQRYTETINLNYSLQEYLYVKFSDLVQSRFREERIVKQYAEQLNVTAKHLGEIVKKYSGRNASRIIKDLVITEAKFLLRNPELNISQIAEILNFSDVSVFGKYFKSETNLSPKQYRVKIFSSKSHIRLG